MRRRAFTLVEILMVMAILGLLASLLFPVFAQARAAAKGARCLSNLHQIGLGTDLYTDDVDGYYPLAVVSEDHFLMGWRPDEDEAVSVYALLPTAPVLRNIMRPYLWSDEVWRCPADEFPQQQLARFADGTRYFDLTPNAFARVGTSYEYKVSLGFDHIQSPAGCVFHDIVDFDYGPTESILFWDFTFKSHEVKRVPGVVADLHDLQQNALYADGHAKHIDGDAFTRGTLCDGN